MIERIQALGHGSFVIQGSPRIYINPWRITEAARDADFILITDLHYAHCSPADIEKLRKPDTRIITSAAVVREHSLEDALALRPWQIAAFDRVCIKAVPAYVPAYAARPQYESGLGFVISMQFYDIYYAGKTGIIPEMEQIHPDIAILPIDGSSALNVAEAVQVTAQMRPRWVIPAHWGTSGVGASRLEAQVFASRAARYSEVVLLQPARV